MFFKKKVRKNPTKGMLKDLREHTTKGEGAPEKVWHDITFALYENLGELWDCFFEHEDECRTRWNIALGILIFIAVIVLLAAGPTAWENLLGMVKIRIG